MAIKKYTIQEIEAALDIIREAIPGITVPQINYGTAVGGKSAPENNATNGATWGTNLNDIPDIVASLVLGILGAWNVTNFNLRSGSSDANSNVLLDPTNSEIRLGATTGDYITLSGILQRIISSNYSTGVSGFKITPTLIEAENIIARGTLRGTTFAYDIISAIGGQLLVANASTLASDMTALDNSTLEIKADTTFAVNDMLVMRAVASSGIQEEHFRVTDASSAPTYTVTRDVAGVFTADENPAWKAGTPVVKQGSSNGTDTYSGGWLKLIGEGTNSPYYAVFQRTGVAYNAYEEVCRLGNLNGFLDYSTDIYGIAIGNNDANLCYDVTNGFRLRGLSSNFFKAVADDSIATTGGGATIPAHTWSYTKLKEIEFNDVPGTIRVTTAARVWNNINPGGDLQVYKNGTAVGVSHHFNWTDGTIDNFTDDITVVPGDLIQVYAKLNGNHNGSGAITTFNLNYIKVGIAEDNTINL